MVKKTNIFNILSRLLVAYLIVCLFIQPALAKHSSTSLNSKGNQSVKKANTNVSDLTDTSDEDDLQKTKINRGMLTKGQMYRQHISVHILGDVTNPGVYKTMISNRAADVLDLANPRRKTVRVIQIRHPGEKTKFYDLYQYYYFGNLGQNPYLKDNDVIFVPKQKGAVRIEGPVARPGIYELNNEKDLYDIIKLAGGFTSSMSKMHPIKVIRYSDGGEKFVLDVVQTKSSLKKFKIKRGDVYIIPDVMTAKKKFD